MTSRSAKFDPDHAMAAKHRNRVRLVRQRAGLARQHIAVEADQA